MAITINDIRKRIRNRSPIESNKISNIPIRLYTESGIFCRDNALSALKEWERFSEDTNIAYSKALDIFDEICLNCNSAQIVNITNTLLEAQDKVRDASKLANLIKHRNSRFKTKITSKINKKTDKTKSAVDIVNGAIKSKIADIGHGNSGGVANTSVKGAETKSAPPSDSEKTVMESYTRLYNHAKVLDEIDRIVENYNKISKRFNLDKMISEVTLYSNINECITDITRCIDTYNIPFKNKYNATIESCFYGLGKNIPGCNPSTIIDTVTDYFIFTRKLSESDIQDIRDIKRISVVFEQSDFNCISFLLNENTNDLPSDEFISINDYGDEVESYGVDIQQSNIDETVKDRLKDWMVGNPEERKGAEAKKMLDEFRAKAAKVDKTESRIPLLRNFINTIFTRNPECIADNLPSIFDWIRSFVLVGITAFNPVVAAVSMIASGIIKNKLSRKSCNRILKTYAKEIERINKKLESDKLSDKDKENLTLYFKQLSNDFKAIEDYESKLYSEKENEDREKVEKPSGGGSDDDFDFDFGFDDDFEWEQASSIIVLSNITQSVLEMLVDDNLDGIVCDNIFKLKNDDIDAVTNFSITVPVILEKDRLCKALTSHRDTLRENNFNIDNFVRIDCLNRNISRLKESANSYNTSTNIKDVIGYMMCVSELAMLKNNGYVNELSFTNNLRIVSKNLKDNLSKLSNKEKQISNSIDVAVNNISRNLEDSMKNDNREAIIRGKILPSASKCIKLACMYGIECAINPAIAIIHALGTFAMSGKIRANERKLVLDDIDIELKMVDRYIHQAEEKGDLEKIKKLEIMKRQLQRQEQRLRYKMKTVWKDDTRAYKKQKED